MFNWHDYVKTTHQSHELRFSTPDDWRLRALLGGFYEKIDIKNDMNFHYRSIPSCTPDNLALFAAGTQVCVGNVIPYPGSAAIDPTLPDDQVAARIGRTVEAVRLERTRRGIPKVDDRRRRRGRGS